MAMYKNVHYITAGAGAGKTTTLVNIIRFLTTECGADPAKMILTTYTKAAAQEFRERSKAALLEAGETDKAVALDRSAMGTVHSIASRYINRYWYLLGMAPDVKPMDKTASGILMNLSLEGLVTGKDADLFKRYAESLGITTGQGGYNYDFWKETLRNLFKMVRSYGFSKEQISSFREQSDLLLAETFCQNVNRDLLDSAGRCMDRYLGFSGEIDGRWTSVENKQYLKNCESIQRIQTLLAGPLTKAALKEIEGMKWGRRPRIEEVAACVEELEQMTTSLANGLVPDDAALIREVTGKLFEMLEDWMAAYEQIKKEYGVIDYADMEEKFLQLLGMPQVQEDIRQSVDYLFVDEFQDSTPIQTRIFETLSGLVRQSWFVGDRKQAIYGFTGSDSGLIAELTETFPEPGRCENHVTDLKKDANGNSSAVLGTSYRSAPSLVVAANQIFSESFSETVADYGNDRVPAGQVVLEPKPGRTDPAPGVLYHVCLQGSKKAEQAEALAAFIGRMITDPGFSEAGYRPSDIAVLSRSREQVKSVAGALTRLGIRTAFVDPDFADSPEVLLVLNLLKLSEGISLGKTRAEIRKLLQDEELAELTRRVVSDENNLDTLEGLEAFVRSQRTLSLPDRIDAFIARFDLLDESACWGTGETRRGHLALLRKVAREYTESAAMLCTAADLRGFLSFVKGYGTDDNNTPFDNLADGVKVLTYHKSKGLEWKIVILYDLDEYKEAHDIRGITIQGKVNSPSGLIVVPALPAKAWVERCMQAQPKAQEVLQLIRAKELGEAKRLLYVGFTRARDAVVTASVSADAERIRRCCPTARTRRVEDLPEGKVDIWGIPGSESILIESAGDPELSFSSGENVMKYRNAGLMLKGDPGELTAKFISPSLYTDPRLGEVRVACAADFGHRTDIPHPGLEDNTFGDAVHHIFAACSPDGGEPSLAAASRTLDAYGIDPQDGAAALVSCFGELTGWLEKTYGPAAGIERELPFRYTRDGQVYYGNMDLVWRTAAGSVLVDYKTFPGRKADLFDTGSPHWAGVYASQLGIYAEALASRDGKVPLACLLYYPVEGLVLSVSY